jgi:hypothetical protein
MRRISTAGNGAAMKGFRKPCKTRKFSWVRGHDWSWYLPNKTEMHSHRGKLLTCKYRTCEVKYLILRHKHSSVRCVFPRFSCVCMKASAARYRRIDCQMRAPSVFWNKLNDCSTAICWCKWHRWIRFCFSVRLLLASGSRIWIGRVNVTA